MGYRIELERVRNTALPLNYRFTALGSYIERARPIGFVPTWQYLEVQFGPWRDPGFLLPAITELEAFRGRRIALQRQYAAGRLAAKRAGQRAPDPTHYTPLWPPRWHGDEAAGARIWLAHQLTLGEYVSPKVPADGSALPELVAKVLRLAGSAVDGDGAGQTTLALGDLETLENLLERVRSPRNDAANADPAERKTELALAQLHIALFGPPRLGQQWTFMRR